MNVILTVLLASQAFAYNWGEGEAIPLDGISNPLNLSPTELKDYNRAGRFHALNYPVTVTGALVPYGPTKDMLNGQLNGVLISLIELAINKLSPFKSFDDFLKWVGLAKYPTTEGQGAYFIPFSPNSDLKANWVPDRVGLSIIENNDRAVGMTFGCATCHSSQLFGKVILGLQTRFPRANRVYVLGDRALRAVPTPLFSGTTKSTKAEVKMYRRTRKNMRFVESRNPRTLGLDTSLAHTALSLSHRKKDDVATKSNFRGTFRHKERLRKVPADSKPGTWWNVKYKNKWLLDGSVVSGNPVFTNILWNEIGRGTDLVELEAWLQDNEQTIDELTAAVYNSEAPHITDFFPADRIDLLAAQRGKKLYHRLSCNKCHGEYHKNWELDNSSQMNLAEQLKTFKVEYHEDTPIKDVGTDSHRYLAMESLEQLNDLRISKKNNAVIKAQKGYVPPPLVGVWARWPYLHNNSIPNLCALLTPENERPKNYWAGEAIDKEKDFDFDCNGYPMGNKTPVVWRQGQGTYYDTTSRAMSNKGHSHRILVKDGKLRFTASERSDLIRFLQTL